MVRILFLVLLLLSACVPRNESKRVELKNIVLTDLSDNPIDVSQYKGKTVLVNFWATWCRPCLQEMPTLVTAQNQLKDQPIVFLFASNEATDQIIQFKNKQKFDFNYLHVGNLEALNIQALPTTFIFNEAGELKFSETGFRDWSSAESIEIISNIIN